MARLECFEMHTGEWYQSLDHDEPCLVVDTDVLWNWATCLVWLPRRGATVRTLQDRLAPLKTSESALLDRLSCASAGAAHDGIPVVEGCVGPAFL